MENSRNNLPNKIDVTIVTLCWNLRKLVKQIT